MFPMFIFLNELKIIPNQETQPGNVLETELDGVDPDKFEDKSIIIGLNTGYRKNRSEHRF